MTLPNIMPLQSDKNCFCRSCLIKNTRNYIENMANQPIQQQLKLAQQHASSNSFLEGLDYDIENGLMVMTRWAHLKRGKCCSNGCRHCPFSKA
ncbi:hypothetical protein J8L98_11485 [Pseudoalteromonas sp. MMG013]|uniref:DUF5522 domain-containing protein n=1 Tax=Pseudoalteromonas sp. MMG013 TaxID=2822687 RepID=UPI001B38DDEB|nr:DUF5522 domain-containing protein [Pseudoalteromonas sp. MMG013]MBQ4862311.1 hypothetical protein [Pseudoalteromonas sp. MMG013]